MNWGDPIRCHQGETIFAQDEFMHWREPDPDGSGVRKPDSFPPVPDGVLGSPYGYPFRTCGYCGSIHPEDLFNFLQHPDIKLNGSDWKYGWPHKFYVEGIPNPIAGRLCVSGFTSQGGVTRWHDPHPEDDFTHAKFYNTHLNDLDAEAFGHLAPLLRERSGIEFLQADGKLKYRAPRHGYQHDSRF